MPKWHAHLGHEHFTPVQQLRVLRLWFGGSAEPALRRTIRIGDRWHGSRLTAEQAAPIVKRLRAARPRSDFAISMRVQWDGTDHGVLRALVDSYAAIGVEHLLVAPHDRNVDDWEAVTEGVGGTGGVVLVTVPAIPPRRRLTPTSPAACMQRRNPSSQAVTAP